MITSTHNAHVKYLRSLCADPRDRRRERSFVIEGVRLVAHALATSADLRVVLYNPDSLRATPAGSALLDQLLSRPGCFAANAVAINAATDTRNPQGVVAAVTWPNLVPQPGLRLVLDGLQDPGNLGTLLRSAEASGVGLVLCAPGCADPFAPKVMRAAMGAHFSLPMRHDLSWDEIGAEVADLPVVYAAAADAAMPYDQADWNQPAALIIGSEAHGLSAAGMTLATQYLAIPMQGRAESLNAAVAGSIMLFEALRQRGGR
ncbi:TrmH family RNA methyltransferase [Candidatus Oscillochloris fontis]|uniref:TrmH family RNA methyltransferase n=1 Tax=Candidatus Oscillochloris fontis TaxID=2496868 RepID=UPI00101C42F2|nr:RNA methyltransferase [Candidatus Oscillochloris fontis]